MRFSKNRNLLFKIFTVLFTVIFLWNQLVFASGGEIPLNISPDQDYKDNIQGYAPQFIQDQHELKNSLIERRNSIERSVKNSGTNVTPDPVMIFYPDADGRLKTREVFNETLEGDFQGKHVKYHYLNENWTDSHGRIWRIDLYGSESDVNPDNIYEISYTGSDDLRISEIKFIDADTGNIAEFYEFYTDSHTNRIKSVKFSAPDTLGNIEYSYYNENWKDRGFGRLESSVLASPDEDGERTFAYYYHEGREKIRYMVSCADTEFSIPLKEYSFDLTGELIDTTSYQYDINGNLVSTIYPDGTKDRFEYEYNGTDIIKSVYLNGRTGDLRVVDYYNKEQGLIFSKATGTGSYSSAGILYNEDELEYNDVTYSYTLQNDILTRTAHTIYTNVLGEDVEHYSVNRYDACYNLISTTGILTPEESADPVLVERKTSTFTYNSDNEIVSAIYTDGSGYRYEYEKYDDGTNKKITMLDLDTGDVSIDNYDRTGRLSVSRKATGSWDLIGSQIMISSIDEQEYVENIYMTDNTSGELTVITEWGDKDITGAAVTYTETSAYSPSGELLTYIDKNGKRTDYAYDTLGRVLKEEVSRTDSQLNEITTYSYSSTYSTFTLGTEYIKYGDTDRSVILEHDTLLKEHKYNIRGDLVEYDETVTSLDGDASFRREKYNGEGDLLRQEIDGEVTEYSYFYDNEDRTIDRIEKEYDTSGNLVRILKYDDRNDLLYEKDCSENIERSYQYTYEYEDTEYEFLKILEEKYTQNFVGVDPIVVSVTKTYDPDGNLVKISDTDNNTTEYIYYGKGETGGSKGDLASIIDAKGNRTEYSYQYDPEDGFLIRKNTVYYKNTDNGLAREYELERQYDSRGRIVYDLNRHGIVTTYEYTETEGIVTSVKENRSYTDVNDNYISVLTVREYSDNGERLQSEILADGTKRTYTYDAEGRITSTRTPEVVTTYTYGSSAGTLTETTEINNRGTATSSDDVIRKTFYSGPAGEERINEIQVLSPGATDQTKPVTRQIYHYNSDNVLSRVEKKMLKDEYMDTGGQVSDLEYALDTDIYYDVFNGEVKKKRVVSSSGREDFVYSEDGRLLESIYTDGLYFSTTKKKYDLSGEVIQTIEENDDELIVTDTVYNKDRNNRIMSKHETVSYKKTGGGTFLEDTVLSTTAYEYYGSDPSDKELYPFEYSNHEIKSLTVEGKTHLYEYAYTENGVLERLKETIIWQENGTVHTSLLQKRFNKKGDIIASIDADGTYSRYQYPESSITELGGKTQRQSIFYRLKDPQLPEKGYELYRVDSFDDVNTSGMVENLTERTYDFENDLIKVHVHNGPGTEDDEITGYRYEKDDFGNIIKKYETSSTRPGIILYEYNLKNDLIAETGRDGARTVYIYERDPATGTVVHMNTNDEQYASVNISNTLDRYGNVLSSENAAGKTTSYSYTKSCSGLLTSSSETVTSADGTTCYTETYVYGPDSEIVEYTGKNGSIVHYDYVRDRYGRVSSVRVTMDRDNGNISRQVIKEYNSDGTEKSVTEINDPDDPGDDVLTTYTYSYDTVTGVLSRKTETDTRYNRTTAYHYDIFGDVKSITDPENITTTYLYEKDGSGKVTRRYMKSGAYPDAVEIEEYDSRGNRISHTTANGIKTTYENTYDAAENLIRVDETKTRHDHNTGDVLWTFTETKEYDARGRLTSFTDKNGVHYTYSYEFDARGRVIKRFETDHRYDGLLINEYDPATGDLISVTNRLGHKTNIEYTRSADTGRITSKKEISSTGETVVTEYNSSGQVTGMIDKNGREFNIKPGFDPYGSMIERTLSWTENIDGYDRELTENEYYSVDGDLLRREDYTGKEFAYQYTKDSMGNMVAMSTIETGWKERDMADINLNLSTYGNTLLTDINAIADDDLNTCASISWTEGALRPSFVLDRDNTTKEDYNTVQIDLKTGEAYRFRVYTATDKNDLSTWNLVADRTDKYYEGFQEICFDDTRDRYVMIEGMGSSGGELKLDIMEARIYNTEDIETVRLRTRTYDTDGRMTSSTSETGETVYYNYIIGNKGEVTKIYEGLTPEEKIDILTPVEIQDITYQNCTYTPDTSIFFDGDLNTGANFQWSEGSGGSLIIDLTSDNTNISDISGIGLSLLDDYSKAYGYKIYYASVSDPGLKPDISDNSIWTLAVDRSDPKTSTDNDLHIDEFNMPVNAKYIKLQACANSVDQNEMYVEELKIYKNTGRPDALKIRELDEFGRVIQEKNALMLAWEERPDLQEIFPEINQKAQTGYWNGKDITDWAKQIGCWEDIRLKKYLADYDNKIYPAISESFRKGDISSSIVNVTAENHSSGGSPDKIIDNNFASWGYIEWADDSSPAHYILELSGIRDLDKIRLKLYDTASRKVKYKIYTSLDGITWGEAIVISDQPPAEDWQEHKFPLTSAKYIKIEGMTGYYGSEDTPLKQLPLQEVMIFDTSDDSEPEEELSNALSDVTVHNVASGAYYNNIIDNSEDSWANIEYTDENDPAYFRIELSEETEIDKISLDLTEDYPFTYKYRIYGSVDGVNWGVPLAEQTDAFISGKHYHLFDPVTVKYLKIEGGGALYCGSPNNRLMISDLRIFINGKAGYAPRAYEAVDMKDWAKKCGFRVDSDLIKFAKTNALTDKADIRTITYKLDDKGTVRQKHESSLVLGDCIKYYNSKGDLVSEILSEVTASRVNTIEDDGIKNRLLHGVADISCRSRYARSESQLRQVVDGNTSTHMGVIEGAEPGAFILDLGEQKELGLIRVLPSAYLGVWYSFKIYTSSTGLDGDWNLRFDHSGEQIYSTWTTDVFEEGSAARYVKVELVDSSGNPDEKELLLSEIKVYGNKFDSIKEFDTYGRVKKETYMIPGHEGEPSISSYKKVKVRSVSDIDSCHYRTQEQLESIIDSDPGTKINVGWSSGDTPASFILNLEKEEELSRIRMRMERSYRYKIYVRDEESCVQDLSPEENWHLVCDRSSDCAPGILQDITFDARKVKQIRIQGVEGYMGHLELTLHEVELYKSSKSSNAQLICEYDEKGNIITGKNLAAIVWEENPHIHKYFITPASTGTGPFSGWTFTRWIEQERACLDSRLAPYRRYASAYTAELARVLEEDPDLKNTFLDAEGNIREQEAVNWAKGCDKTLYPELMIYAQQSSELEDPYLATYSYSYDEDEILRSRAKTVNLSKQVQTIYDENGDTLSESIRTVDLTQKEYEYFYYENGNVRKLSTTATGKESGSTEIVYNHNGDAYKYSSGGETYNYEYTYDKWGNTLKISSEGQDTIMLADIEVMDENTAVTRIIEYYRAMLYRDPDQEELDYSLQNWRDTGLTNLARDVIYMSEEYREGNNPSFEETALTERDQRALDMNNAYALLEAEYSTLAASRISAVSDKTDHYAELSEKYDEKTDKNDKKYITGIYREVLGREATETELDEGVQTLRANNWTLEDLRTHLKSRDEHSNRRAFILEVINLLYDTENNTGLLMDYMNSADRKTFLSDLGFEIDSKYLADIDTDDISSIMTWLKSQDNHFGRSAVEALYKQLLVAGIDEYDISGTDPSVTLSDEATRRALKDLLLYLVFMDIVTGGINTDSQGMLLISMFSVKKVSQKYGFDIYGTEYSFDELLRKFNEIDDFSAIVHYNNNHFLNITGVIRDAEGRITRLVITNGFINGVEQTKEIAIDEFKANYEGKILSAERSDYDKRLSDHQLQNIRGAGWWSDLWKAVVKWFKGVVKAIKKVVENIINVFKQFFEAICYAIKTGKFGRLIGAVGTMLVASVVAGFAASVGMVMTAYQIMSTAMSMATAICYGEYGLAFKILAMGAISIALSAAIETFAPVLLDNLNKAIPAIGNTFSRVSEVVGEALNKTLNFVTDIGKTVIKGIKDGIGWIKSTAKSFFKWMESSSTPLYQKALASLGVGSVITAVSRHVSDEMNRTSNWLSKIGIGLAGALALMPINAFASPTWGTNLTGDLTNQQFTANLMLEAGFSSMNQILSNETYKALEDDLGEEWYGDILRISTNGVISAAMGVLKNSFHGSVISAVYKPTVDANGNYVLVDADGNTYQATNVVENADGTKIATWETRGITAEYAVSGTVTKQVMNRYMVFSGNVLEQELMSVSAYYDGSGQNIVDWGFDAQWLEYYYGDELGGLYDTIIAQSDGETVALSVVEKTINQSSVDADKATSFLDNLKTFATNAYNGLQSGMGLISGQNPVLDYSYNSAKDWVFSGDAQTFKINLNNFLRERKSVSIAWQSLDIVEEFKPSIGSKLSWSTDVNIGAPSIYNSTLLKAKLETFAGIAWRIISKGEFDDLLQIGTAFSGEFYKTKISGEYLYQTNIFDTNYSWTRTDSPSLECAGVYYQDGEYMFKYSYNYKIIGFDAVFNLSKASDIMNYFIFRK